jgi:hypothetical protein
MSWRVIAMRDHGLCGAWSYQGLVIFFDTIPTSTRPDGFITRAVRLVRDAADISIDLERPVRARPP